MKKASLIEILLIQNSDLSKDTLYSRIMCGEVLVNGERVTDPARKIPLQSDIQFDKKKYVSRGGLKLEAALEKWKILPQGKVFIDAGSSTGGFTDCLLQKGASFVHAVDVGYNQLAYNLRMDNRVAVRERCNIMHLEDLQPIPAAAVVDLSFRSIKGAARHIIELTSERWVIALVKPQFEIDVKKFPEFDGIIREKKVLKIVLDDVLNKINEDNLKAVKVMVSPVKGKKGNIEFLFLLKEKESSADTGPVEGLGNLLSDF